MQEVLNHFDALKVEGGVILVDNEVRAFGIGELLNEQMAVIHIEKADPDIPELYAVVNQQFCENQWQNTPLLTGSRIWESPDFARPS